MNILMKTLNKVGEMTLPWRVPLSTEKSGVVRKPRTPSNVN
jgi:hypothetical protein